MRLSSDSPVNLFGKVLKVLEVHTPFIVLAICPQPAALMDSTIQTFSVAVATV